MGQTQPPLSASSMQLTEVANATANSTGSASFAFPGTPNGSTWTGTIACESAPPAAVFVATIGATAWGDWAGSSIGGPIQAFGMQTLVVTATGLTPGVDYLMTWTGSADPAGLAAPIWPDPTSSAQTVQFASPSTMFGPAAVTAVGGLVNQQVTIPAGIRTLLIFIQSNPGALTCTGVSVVGATSSMIYYNQPPYLPGNIGTAPSYLVVVPVAPAIDPVVTVVFSFVTAAWQGTIEIGGDSAIYDESVFYNGTAKTIATVAVGATTLLTGPARLLSCYAGCGAAAGSSSLVRVNGAVAVEAANGAGAFPQNVPLTFPDDTILQAGATVTATITTSGVGSVVYAYP